MFSSWGTRCGVDVGLVWGELGPLGKVQQPSDLNSLVSGIVTAGDSKRIGFVDSALSVEDIMTVGIQKADIIMRDGAPEKPEDRFIDVGVVSREIAAMKAAQKKRK
jgi:hypothetical protein